MRALITVLLTLPLCACEPESLMERSGAALDDAGDEITDTIEDAREEAGENIEEVVD